MLNLAKFHVTAQQMHQTLSSTLTLLKFEELMMKKLSFLATTLATATVFMALTTTAVLAKLPAPSDEAKEKAADTFVSAAMNKT